MKTAFHQLRSAGDEDKEARHGARQHGQHQQPAGDRLPHRQGEEIEPERPAEDGVGDPTGMAGLEPVEGVLGPVGHHAGGRGQGDDNGADGRADTEGAFDRKLEDAVPNANGAGLAQVGVGEAHEDGEPAVEDGKGGHKEEAENRPLQAQRPEEDGAITEGAEPQGVDVVRDGGPEPEHDQSNKDQDEEKEAAPGAARGLMRHQNRIVSHGCTAFTSFSRLVVGQTPL
jgi:hypothetical protein